MPTKIEWATESWNPVTGCSPISEGCTHCYAERMSKRLAGRFGYPADEPFRVTFHKERYYHPAHWRKPRRIFVCSMGDLFHRDVPTQWINRVFHMCLSGLRHTFLILTKRPERMRHYIIKHRDGIPLPNVWLGVTVENQKRADERIPILLQIPAAVRFVSVEPMLSCVYLNRYLPCPDRSNCADWFVLESDFLASCRCEKGRYLDWVIAGAETGSGARPMDLNWARSLHDQCQEAGVAFFFKKDSDGNRTLDGQMWEEYPCPSS